MLAIVQAVSGDARIPNHLRGSLWRMTMDDLDQAFADGFQKLVDDGEAGAEAYLHPVVRAGFIETLLKAAARPGADRDDVVQAASDLLRDIVGDAVEDADLQPALTEYVARMVN